MLMDCANCTTSMGIIVRDLDDPTFDLTIDAGGVINQDYVIKDKNDNFQVTKFRVYHYCKSDFTQMKNSWPDVNQKYHLANCDIGEKYTFQFWRSPDWYNDRCANSNSKCRHKTNEWKYGSNGAESSRAKWKYRLYDGEYRFVVQTIDNPEKSPAMMVHYDFDVAQEDRAIFKFE